MIFFSFLLVRVRVGVGVRVGVRVRVRVLLLSPFPPLINHYLSSTLFLTCTGMVIFLANAS